jgi:hypothetical protein
MSKQCYFADQDRPSEVLTVRTLQRVRITRDPQFHTMRQIVCTAPRTWSLLEESGQSLGTLVRPKWWSNNAELVVPEGLVQLRPTKVLHRSISAFRDDLPVLEVRYPWRGGMELVPMNDPGGALRVERTAWFKEEWSITDKDGSERARIKHRFNWKRFGYEPELVSESSDPLSAMQLLSLVHAIFIFQRRRSAAVS